MPSGLLYTGTSCGHPNFNGDYVSISEFIEYQSDPKIHPDCPLDDVAI